MYGQELGMDVSRRRCVSRVGHRNDLVPRCLQGRVNARERGELAKSVGLAKCVHREGTRIHVGSAGTTSALG